MVMIGERDSLVLLNRRVDVDTMAVVKDTDLYWIELKKIAHLTIHLANLPFSTLTWLCDLTFYPEFVLPNGN